MKGAALARAAKGWHADARDRALGADLKNEAIVYIFYELVLRLKIAWSSSSKLRRRLRHALPRSRLELSSSRLLQRSFFLHNKNNHFFSSQGAFAVGVVYGFLTQP